MDTQGCPFDTIRKCAKGMVESMKKEVVMRIEALRKQMAKEQIDYYIVPTCDYHNSEYVCEFFKAREFLSGFTGSNGTLLVTKEEAFLWTDGRYFIQAKNELDGTGIEMKKMGIPGEPSLLEYVKEMLKKGEKLAFYGKTMNCQVGKKLEKIVKQKEALLYYEKDLVHNIWQNRPALPERETFVLPADIAGVSTQEKLSLVREKMKEADVHVLSKLDDLMWLFNIRGKDIPCNPVVLSYGIITQTEAFLFLRERAVTEEVRTYLEETGVILKSYEEFYDCFLEVLKEKTYKVLLDEREVNYTLYKLAMDNSKVLAADNPTALLKACKSKVELENMRKVYLLDSVAVVKFIYYMKEQMKKPDVCLTEMDAAEYIDALRTKIEGYLEPSFTTISAYRENAAMMHYEATCESNKKLEAEGFLLVDSGGQYLGGTTDVTRTISLGKLTEEEKRDFTLVAVGMLRLTNAKFLYGVTGRSLDVLARAPLWAVGKDYKCGTGHGIGYILNVHEGPQRISSSYVPGNIEAVLEEGMVITNEPGVYVENSHGIRTENVMVCQKDEKTQDGQFMRFETLTYAPIDLEAIEPEYMTKQDKEMLNAYHKLVYEKVAPYLEEEEKEWLLYQTREI